MILPISKKAKGLIEIDLTGPDGNAYFLLGCAQQLAKQHHLDSKTIQQEMMDGDYNNLITVFDKYFGKYVILYRWKK
jgi:hypothetical protein